MDRPNIVYIHSHDTGRFVQPYGHPVPTPNIQRLADGGVVFRNAFCANPTCSASRSALLTGQYPHVNGMVGLAHRGFSLNNYDHHLVPALNRAGYLTALSGTQHESAGRDGKKPWEVIGYQQHLGDTPMAEHQAAAFLADAPSQPFFLSVGFNQTHRPLPPGDDPAAANHLMPPPYFPDTPETRRDFEGFLRSAATLDRRMGVVFDALEANGLAENTLVICTTDHGIAFPGMKCNLVDGGIGVMLIMRGPGGFEGGRAVDAMVSHVDLFPTVCELAGAEVNHPVQGVSILPLVRGEAESVREEVHAEVNFHAAYEPMRCVRTTRWKYIRRYGSFPRVVGPNCDDGLTRDVFTAHGWLEQEPPREALYDLVFDPQERCNVADREPEALADMRARLDRWMRETDDPLLQGPVPAPEGAIVNHPEAPSAGATPPYADLPGEPPYYGYA